jgi:light-regulated signal transduction histidine kinase (bacteriophytochrome)
MKTDDDELAALAYSISHDLRAPLRIIGGFSDALAEDYHDRLDADGLEYLQRIREAGRRMESLVDAVLEYSRVSRAPLREETVDVSAIAAEVSRALEQSDPSRRVEFSIEPSLVVIGDRALLRLALEHLLANAWKFTRRHPIARIEVGGATEDGRRVIFVRDDGAGFDPAYAGRMFSLFQRFHPESEFGGVGAGLALVRRIVSRHGGRVWADGRVEGGATVYIDLT